MMTYFATPNTMDSLPVREGEAYERVRNAGGRKNREATGNLREQVIYRLPTPNTMDHLPARTPEQKEANKGKGGYANVRETVINEIGTNWGKFEPAIKRWEETLGRPAPAPTKPDGKDGAHRLSSAFTEWMMGVPEGWITDCGLTRNEELKACGNGVVPQQAELALRVLLEGIALPRGGGK
jgi:DNA (cytosine-5)-methyltransferase 1